MRRNDDIARLFAGYERAFSALDAEAIVGMYADCCIAAAPQLAMSCLVVAAGGPAGV